MFSPFPSKEACKGVFFGFVFFPNTRYLELHFQYHFSSIESKSNYSIELELKFHSNVFESIHLNLNSIELNSISIQFNLHALPFNISIQMEFNSHKNHLFHQLIS
jgi:hypothetical protein